MAKEGVVAPSTFTFRNLCVRAVLRQEAGGGTGAHHWIAEDIRNVLFQTNKAGPKRPDASPKTMLPAQARMLQDLWTSFDDDKSGKLDLKEVEQVLAAALPDMTQKDLERAFVAMDEDGSGEIDLHEFSRWWAPPALAPAHLLIHHTSHRIKRVMELLIAAVGPPPPPTH